jgi:hypothetical protein
VVMPWQVGLACFACRLSLQIHGLTGLERGVEELLQQCSLPMEQMLQGSVGHLAVVVRTD